MSTELKISLVSEPQQVQEAGAARDESGIGHGGATPPPAGGGQYYVVPPDFFRSVTTDRPEQRAPEPAKETAARDIRAIIDELAKQNPDVLSRDALGAMREEDVRDLAKKAGVRTEEEVAREPAPENRTSLFPSEKAAEQAQKELDYAVFREEVEQAKRQLNDDYRLRAEELDTRRELADAIAELTEARRQEGIDLAQMSEEERVAYSAEKEARRQREAAQVKDAAYEKRLETDPQFRRDEQMRAAQHAVEDHDRQQAAELRAAKQQVLESERRAREAERIWRSTPEGMAETATENAEKRRDAERLRRDPRSPYYDEQYDIQENSKEFGEETRRHDAAEQAKKANAKAQEDARRQSLGEDGRMREDMRAAKDKAEMREKIDRELNPAKYAERDRREQERAYDKQFEAFGPLAGTVKGWVRAYKAFTGSSQQAKAPETADQPASVPVARAAPSSSQVVQQAPAAPPPQPSPSHASDASDMSAVTGAAMEGGLNPIQDIVAAGVLVVDALGNIAGNVNRVAGDFVQIGETVMQGGEHMASSLTDSAGDVASATVDWIPVIGGALGQIVSLPMELASKAIRVAEDMGKFVGDTMRSGAEAGAHVLEFDAKGLAMQMADLAERRIPVLGTVAKGAADSIFALDKATENAASRLADYSGALAQQRAFEDVANIMRDVQRAQRFGDQLAQAEAQRFNFDTALQRLGDRFYPFILELTSRLFSVLSTVVDTLDQNLRATLQGLDSVVQWLREFSLTPAAMQGTLDRIHQLIQQALADSSAGVDFITQEWERMRVTNRSVASNAFGRDLSRPALQSIAVPGV